MIWGFAILFAVYFICMMLFVYGYHKVPIFTSEIETPEIGFSVVIPFRNEAENLPNLLRTIEKLKYSSELLEIIFVNDASEDTSETIIYEAVEGSKFSIKLIQNQRISASPKKDAITEAIKHSNFKWIVTTDADCELPQNWLKTLDAFIQKNKPVMVCGPVIYECNGSFIENFQQLDGFSLQTIAVGSFGLRNPLLGNGANLGYSKEAFLKVNGFSGNDHLASGDDIFLLEKMKKTFPEQVRFLKSAQALVFTNPQKNWKDVISQRIRWASKTSKQQNSISVFLGLIVFLVNLSILAFPFFIVFDAENLIIFLSLFIFKIITDYSVVHQTALFYEEEISFWKFLWQPFLYAAIVVIVVTGSFRGNYSWKGRTFEKQG